MMTRQGDRTDTVCRRCQRDPQPTNFGTPRRCAFTAAGAWQGDNWRCATLDALLDIRDEVEHWGEDESLQVIFAGAGLGGWVALTRYKSRGATALAYYISQERCEPLSLALAEEVLLARRK